MSKAKDNIQHCNNARKILSEMTQVMQQSQSKGAAAGNELVAKTYMSKVTEASKAQLDKMEPGSYIDKSNEALRTCIFQLHAINEVASEQKSGKGPDFM